MRLTESLTRAVAGAACIIGTAQAQVSAELLDLAGRIHYGFYQADLRAIEAASAALDRLAESPEVHYYRDYAALRRAQLGTLDREATKRLGGCASSEAGAALEDRAAAEAWVLAAACAFVAGDERRLAVALERARSADADNPRVALIEAWRLERSGAADGATAQLAATVQAFDAFEPSIDDPDWGHAEALTALAASTLARGEARAARDLLERALLLAPGYRRAVELRTAMQGTRGNRTL
jgi:hypothetical protein